MLAHESLTVNIRPNSLLVRNSYRRLLSRSRAVEAL